VPAQIGQRADGEPDVLFSQSQDRAVGT
jgi:hypothetical protein